MVLNIFVGRVGEYLLAAFVGSIITVVGGSVAFSLQVAPVVNALTEVTATHTTQINNNSDDIDEIQKQILAFTSAIEALNKNIDSLEKIANTLIGRIP